MDEGGCHTGEGNESAQMWEPQYFVTNGVLSNLSKNKYEHSIEIRNWRTLLHIDAGRRCVHSPGGSTFIREKMMSRPPYWEGWHRIENPSPSIRASLGYAKNVPAKFHPDTIWNDRALGFFEDGLPNKKKNKKKMMSSDMRSTPDLITRRKGQLATLAQKVVLKVGRYSLLLHALDSAAALEIVGLWINV